MDESIYFSLNKSDICRICGENNALKTFLIYEKSGASELTIADLINRYLPVQVNKLMFRELLIIIDLLVLTVYIQYYYVSNLDVTTSLFIKYISHYSTTCCGHANSGYTMCTCNKFS